MSVGIILTACKLKKIGWVVFIPNPVLGMFYFLHQLPTCSETYLENPLQPYTFTSLQSEV